MFDAFRPALTFAAMKHDGQRRKYTNEPYITHLIAVAGTVSRFVASDTMVNAALLHDVLEDTDATYDEVDRVIGPLGAKYVLLLTDCGKSIGNRAARKAVDRARLCEAPGDVQTIKCADLIDNSGSIVQHDPDFAKVYLKEKRAMLDALHAAHPMLREAAYHVLRQAEEKLAAVVG